MEPHDVFMKNRAKFDQDLADLISAAAAASSTANTPNTVLTTPSPPRDPRLRKPALPQEKTTKRIKLEDSVRKDALAHDNVHPSRRVLLKMPRTATAAPDSGFDHSSRESPLRVDIAPLQRTGSNTVPLGATLKRSFSKSTGSTARHIGSYEPNSTRSDHVNLDAGDKSRLSTRHDVVWRQWDSAKDVGLSYEQLLQNRRTEHLSSKVDRYVPISTSASSHRIASFPYSKLPEQIRSKILALLLLSHEPIVIDFTWLRSFITGHCRVPVIEKVFKVSASSVYTVPIEWDQLAKDVSTMEVDCIPFKPALEDRGNKTRKRKAPCRGLTTGLLTVSRDVHIQASTVFYGKNRFRFPTPSSAWLQLESFLATIGPTNAGNIRNITIHCPLWHRGIKEDFLEGAILDLTSPASRLGVVKSTSRDRLLTAIAGSVEALLKSGKLENLALDLEHGLNAERWAGNYSNTRRLIAMADADEHVSRKQEGVRLLKILSESLHPSPVVTIYHQTPAIGKHDLSEFRSRLARVIREAAKYGWKVDQRLQIRRW
ncbi:uncharacterized protein RCC_05121 [Ramularia collo-cygni]|uniref:Uncharacterized protein n=1 Tax=Ramularia collo-cygni TaxID=112498 RepID=A0A2D3UY43_9PEZI|nr:uncharacterized protein RCC_05121 [Ramularia collo-cygni]CZT19275.1 uncharacterized protein RCC_05121 [Ramularia collo-cygni]